MLTKSNILIVRYLLNKYFDIAYFTIIFIAIGLSLVYGQILETNIGQFSDFMVFGEPLSLGLIVLIPIIITCIYGIAIFIAYKNNLLKFNATFIGYTLILLVMLLYMGVLIFNKDNSHLYNPSYSGNAPNFNDRLQSFFSFYLEIMMIFSFYFLYKRTKNSKVFIEIILVCVGIYALISIIYSLSTELDKYIYVLRNFSLVDKDYGENLIKSFYGIGNVFGHTTYCAAVAMIFLALLSKKYYLGLFSLIFIPFIFFSQSRAGILSIVIFFIIYFIGYLFVILKRNFKLGIILISIVILVLFVIILDTFLFKNIHVKFGDNSISLYELFSTLFKQLFKDRFTIISDIYSKANIIDYIFGLGYGVELIVPRTYGYIYYMHNTFVEYYAIGGIPYSVLIIGIILISLNKCVKIRDENLLILLVFISLLISQCFYGLGESIPILSNNFFGAVFGLYFVVIPNYEYDEYFDRCQIISPIKIFNKKI